MLRTLLLGASIAALGTAAASAADLIIPTTPQPIYEAAGFDWEGLYVGARIGGTSYNSVGSGHVGLAAGVNFIPVDPLLLGVEVTGDWVWGNGVNAGEYFANLRAGAVVTDSVLVYAIGGVGGYSGNGFSVGEYQLGAGVEFAVTDAVTVRGEVVGLGDFDGANDNFFEGAKGTVGVFYHF